MLEILRIVGVIIANVIAVGIYNYKRGNGFWY